MAIKEMNNKQIRLFMSSVKQFDKNAYFDHKKKIVVFAGMVIENTEDLFN